MHVICLLVTIILLSHVFQCVTFPSCHVLQTTFIILEGRQPYPTLLRGSLSGVLLKTPLWNLLWELKGCEKSWWWASHHCFSQCYKSLEEAKRLWIWIPRHREDSICWAAFLMQPLPPGTRCWCALKGWGLLFIKKVSWLDQNLQAMRW